MKKIFYFVMVFAALSFTLRVNAQVNTKSVPVYQPPPLGIAIDNNNWKLQDGTNGTSDLSDEFNNASLNTNKWYCADMCIGNWYGWPYADFYRPEEVKVTGGNLVLTIEKWNTWNSCGNQSSYYPFLVGQIFSSTEAYHYGYYEMLAKLPGFYDQNNRPVGLGFYSVFWEFHMENTVPAPACCTTPPYFPCCPIDHPQCRKIQDEIDILEADGTTYKNADANVYGFHDEYGALQQGCGSRKIGQGKTVSADPLFNNYHKYGLEFLSDRIYFYFDDQPYGWAFLNPKFNVDTFNHALKMQKMKVAFGLDIDGWVYTDPTVHNGLTNKQRIDAYSFSTSASNGGIDYISPATTMYVDYFHYYQLDITNCTNPITIQNNTQLDNFTFGVRKSITFDGIINTNTTSTNNNTFRATDFIDVRPGFDAPAGSVLNLTITPCDN